MMKKMIMVEKKKENLREEDVIQEGRVIVQVVAQEVAVQMKIQ